MDAEINKMCVEVEYFKGSEYADLSNKDRKILSKNLRSKIGFDISSLKEEKKVEEIHP
jgi:hypothetical protein